MNYSPKDFVTPDEILAEVLLELDEERHLYITRGGFVSQMQKCLEALSFDTFFHEVTVMENIPQNLRMDIPKGMFNLRRMYLFNGEECAIGKNTVNVYHKRHFYRKGGGEGYLANNKGLDQRRDPFFSPTNGSVDNKYSSSKANLDNQINQGKYPYYSDYSNLHYYEIQAGIIMFSSNCRSFQRVAMVYNGIYTDIGEQPIVPTYLREVLKDWCVEYGARIKKVKDKQNAQLWNSVYQDVNRRLGRNPFNFYGTWANAEKRVKNIDSKEREDLKEYMSKLDY